MDGRSPCPAAETLSVVVIALNEARDIPACLESVAFAGERLVVDSGSTDGTVEAAAACGARVLQHPFESFSAQKQWACDQASGGIVLVLDADETACPGMARMIEEASRRNPDVQAWRIRRRTRYLGRVLRFGPWMGDAPVRLFRSGRASFGDEAVHERIRSTGRTSLLDGAWIEHTPYADVSEHMQKMMRYTRLWADQQIAGGRRARCWDPPARAAWRLFRAMFLQLAFLDGFPGMAASMSSAVYAYWKWLRLWELVKDREMRSGR